MRHVKMDQGLLRTNPTYFLIEIDLEPAKPSDVNVMCVYVCVNACVCMSVCVGKCVCVCVSV